MSTYPTQGENISKHARHPSKILCLKFLLMKLPSSRLKTFQDLVKEKESHAKLSEQLKNEKIHLVEVTLHKSLNIDVEATTLCAHQIQIVDALNLPQNLECPRTVRGDRFSSKAILQRSNIAVKKNSALFGIRKISPFLQSQNGDADIRCYR